MVRRAVVAAEDANFCTHWGIDSAAVRQALREGLCAAVQPSRSKRSKRLSLAWAQLARTAVEALLTPYIEMVWSKRRLLEIYLNIAEFDTGVFGIEAQPGITLGLRPKI